MKYLSLGNSALFVSQLGLGTGNFGSQIDLQKAKSLVQVAFDHGINFFDTAEIYGAGHSELILGECLQRLPRDKIVLSTKIYQSSLKPNEKGLSKKHIVEGLSHSLRRLQTNYVDLLFCHQEDPDTPLEETLEGMDLVVRQGKALYWGTSKWSPQKLEKAYELCEALGYIKPIVEQSKYHMLSRKRIERDLDPIVKKRNLGLTIYSPLAGGVLTGKYLNEIPKTSRFAKYPHFQISLDQDQKQSMENFSRLCSYLNLNPGCAAIAWCIQNPNVQSAILGVSSLAQLEQNLQAIHLEKLPERLFSFDKAHC